MTRPIAIVLLFVFSSSAFSQSPKPYVGPTYIDDTKLFEKYLEKLKALAKAKKCLSAAEIAEKIEANPELATPITTVPAKATALAPEDVYDAILPSVVILGSVKPSEDDPTEFEDGGFGTAWCLTADGIFITNYHMFANSKNELFGIGTHKGEVFPVVDILSVDPVADVAVFRVSGKGFTPLSVSDKPARVGSWIATLGHPGNQMFTFTQGNVTRYSKEKVDKGTERWMSITAEYAQGSSGGPVVDRFGNVVGMAAMTVNIDAIDEPTPDPEKKDKPKEKPDDVHVIPSTTVQMVVKLAVPVSSIRKAIGGK
jgi:serine protease Do